MPQLGRSKTKLENVADIFCCRNGYPGRMEPGVTFTVEPAISEGSPQVRKGYLKMICAIFEESQKSGEIDNYFKVICAMVGAHFM